MDEPTCYDADHNCAGEIVKCAGECGRLFCTYHLLPCGCCAECCICFEGWE